MNSHYLNIVPYEQGRFPAPVPGKSYMLYAHVPFCESLCPYCSFNRYPFEEGKARSYFECLREEMRMVARQGYRFDSMYIGGGTPTILPDELASTIRLAKELFGIEEVSTETNPNHLDEAHLQPIQGLVDRMSVGVQSFDNGLLKQMCRYGKYGSGEEILERLKAVASGGLFKTLNADMIFNFPDQNEEMLRRDIALIRASGCNQATFYPLMASPSVEQSLKNSVGTVNYKNERRFYEIICEEMTGGDDPFGFGSVWTFRRGDNGMIDEYVVDHEEYPAVGAGGMAFLNREYFINEFHLDQYEKKIREGRQSIWGSVRFNKRDHMRYRFLMQLFGTRIDVREWQKDFGCTVRGGLPAEYLFLKAAGAFDRDNREELTLSPKGRYLLLVMMRQFFIGVNTVRDKARG